ncbi:MAG: hypothetical protein IJW70_03645 [Clostridia bacterium]|nr:hypothetical protein [Clostridia bacterium]
MDIWAKILSSALIPVVVGVVLALMRFHGDTPRGLVRYGKFMGIISTVLLALMAGFALLCAFAGKRWDLSLLFFANSLIPAALLLAYFNFRIRYDDQGFEIRGMLGVTRRYTYDQITGIKHGAQDATLRMAKRRVSVDDFMLGSREFIAHAQKQYKKQAKGETIPPIKPRIDPFGGHVREPGLYVFLIILLEILGIGMFLFSIFTPSCPRPIRKKPPKRRFALFPAKQRIRILCFTPRTVCYTRSTTRATALTPKASARSATRTRP